MAQIRFNSRVPYILAKVLLVVLFVAGLLGIFWKSYHDGRLPYQLENFVHESGLWKVLGKRELHIDDMDGAYLVDPRLDLVSSVQYQERLQGYLTALSEEEITLGVVGSGERTIELGETVSVYYYEEDTNEERLCARCSLAGLEGAWVEVLATTEFNPEDGSAEMISTKVVVHPI